MWMCSEGHRSVLEGIDVLDLGSWCILRTASSDTLSTCDALVAMGFLAWTPRERRIGKLPRTQKTHIKKFPMMPTYVFAPAVRMDELLALSVVPATNCPPFTIFKYDGGFPLIADGELDALRAEEERRNEIFERQRDKGRKPPVFKSGLEVILSKAGFKGLRGKVVESEGSFTIIDIPGFVHPIKIASLQLERDVLAGECTIDRPPRHRNRGKYLSDNATWER